MIVSKSKFTDERWGCVLISDIIILHCEIDNLITTISCLTLFAWEEGSVASININMTRGYLTGGSHQSYKHQHWLNKNTKIRISKINSPLLSRWFESSPFVQNVALLNNPGRKEGLLLFDCCGWENYNSVLMPSTNRVL